MLDSHILRIAAELPVGDPTRRDILAALQRQAKSDKVKVKRKDTGKVVEVSKDTLKSEKGGQYEPIEDGDSKDKGGQSSGAGGGGSRGIKNPKGGEHKVISGQGGNTVFMGSYTTDHIKGHTKPGLGSVFSDGVDMDAIVKAVSEGTSAKFFSDGGGISTIKVPGAGRDLVKKVSDIKERYPNAREIEIEKQEGIKRDKDGNPERDADGNVIPNMVKAKAFVLPDDDDGGEWTQTDQVNVIMRPANPQFMPDEAKNDEQIKGALDDKKGFAVLTAFPGNPDVPKTSEWGDDWAVIIPSGGKGADEKVQAALKGGKKASLQARALRIASELPVGDPTRQAILAAIQREAREVSLKVTFPAANRKWTVTVTGDKRAVEHAHLHLGAFANIQRKLDDCMETHMEDYYDDDDDY